MTSLDYGTVEMEIDQSLYSIHTYYIYCPEGSPMYFDIQAHENISSQLINHLISLTSFLHDENGLIQLKILVNDPKLAPGLSLQFLN